MEDKEIIVGRGFFYVPEPLITLKVTVEGQFDTKRMQTALLWLEDVHPIINNVVRKEGSRLFFCDTERHVDLNVNYNVSWSDVMHKVIQTPINLEREPGVRVAVAVEEDCFHLLMFCHHAYGDGMSIKQLADDLLYMYHRERKLAVREPMTMLTAEQLPQDCKIPLDLYNKLTKVNDHWDEHRVDFTAEMYEEMCKRHEESVGHAVTLRSIRGSAYRKLCDKCKELNVTITAAISTAIIAVIQNRGGSQAIVAANARPLLGLEAEKGIANFATCIRQSFTYNFSKSFWDNVKEFDVDLKANRKNKSKVLETLHTFLVLDGDVFGAAYFAHYGMYTDLEAVKQLQGALGLSATEAEEFDISNLGKLEFDCASEDFVVRDCFFVPNLTMACECTFGAVSMGNVLTISLGYKPKVTPEQKAKLILQGVISYLVNNV